ncbi:MAG: hypothetical protein ABUT20_03890 [Bacteroidota bacterium]
MKKNTTQSILLTTLLIVLLTSCVRSLYPITENEKEMVFKKELLGNWKDKDGVRYFVDTSASPGPKVYRVEIIDTGNNSKSFGKEAFDTSYFIAALVNIKGKLFLDCSAEMEQLTNKKVGETAINSLLPTHIIIRVFSIEQNSIELASIDNDELSTLIKQKKVNILHESINKDDILVTEKSKMLQQKLTEFEKFPSIYKERNRLIRIM